MKSANVVEKSNLMFLIGAFVSSVGSLSFAITASAVMLMSGFSLLEIGVFAAVSRFSGLAAVFLLGEKADVWDPKRLIVYTEAVGFIAAIGLAYCWTQGRDLFPAFLLFTALRSFVLGIQGPGRAKIAKALASHDFRAQSRSAIWLNKVTHGAILFAATLSWIFVKRFNLYYAIGFDMLTFIVNGVLVWFFVEVNTSGKPKPPVGYLNKFKLLYKYAPQAALLDLLLATSLCGINTFYVRLAGENSSVVPLCHAIYGIAVWTTGFSYRLPRLQALHGSYWFLLSGLLVLMSFSLGHTSLLFLILFLVFVCYWLLFHRYSSLIQHSAPDTEMASITAARIVQMTVVISAGEFFVGAWSKVLPIQHELYIRSAVGLLVGSAVVFSSRGLRSENI